MARQLVIELVGEASKFVKSLDQAETASKTFGDKVEGVGKKMTVFASVPIAGFLAGATKAAMDDAAAQAHLAETLKNNIGNSKGLVDQVESYIGKAMKASTFTDDELRPAFELFATTTKSADESQKLLAVAMDVAAGKGISLETAATAVAKAQQGQLAAANKLVPGLIDVKDETLTAEQAMAKLSSTFSGQAQAATETTAGKMQNLKRDLGEASEEMGTKLLPAITAFAGFATDTLIPTLDKLTGGNGAFVLLGVMAAGPVLSNIGKLKTGVDALNLTLDSTAVKATAALGALGIVISGANEIRNTEGGLAQKILGDSAVSRFIGKIPGLAAGGPVSAGSPYVVGERGPELFVPGRSGSIVPNGAGGTQVIQLVLDSRVITEVVHSGLLAKQRRTPLGIAT
jgi:hypothetical protein